MANLKTYIHSLRQSRIWHRYLGLFLALLLLISSITGILLALKKDVTIIQPPTQRGISKSLEDWKSIAELSQLAASAFYTQYPDEINNKVKRIDVRPSKGIAKVLFDEGYWEVQIDGSTGEIRSIAKRHSDWIEALHDGSIVSDVFKLISMNTLGFGVLLMIATGTWLYFGPKKVREMKRR
ncbi:MAG: PepSY domain-containing protein [Bacteroidota bacterium]